MIWLPLFTDMTISRGAAAAVTVLALSVAGCSADSLGGEDVTPTSSPSAARTAPTTGDPAVGQHNLEAIDATDIKDVAKIEVRWAAEDPDGTSRNALAMYGDEVLLGVVSGGQTALEVRTINGDVAAEVPAREQRAVRNGDLNESTVVWTEATSTDLGVEPWVLYAYDRRSEQVTELAKAPLIDGTVEPPPAPGFTGPALSGKWVFWAQSGGTIGAETAGVFGCEVRACKPEQLVAGAAFPAPTEDGLYYVEGDRYTGNREGHSYAIGRIDLASGTQETIRELDFEAGQGPSGFDADAGHAIVTASAAGLGWAEIVDTTNGEVVHKVTSAPNGSFTFPTMTDRLAVWGEGNSGAATTVGGYVLDLATGQVHSVGNMNGFYFTEASGNRVLWQDTVPVDDGEDGLSVEMVIGQLP